MRRLLLLLLLLSAANPALAQQGVISSGAVLNVGPASAISVAIAPSPSVTVVQSQTQNFVATILNDQTNAGVNWTLSGPTCSGATCGATAPTFSRTTQTVVYTAPAAIPSNPSVTLTATSVADGTKFASVSIVVISGASNPPIIVNPGSPQTPPKQTAATANTFPLAATTGPGYVVAIGTGSGATITTVVGNPGNISFTTVGCQGDQSASDQGSHTALYYATGAPAGLTSVTVNETSPNGSTNIAFYDLGNASASSFLIGAGACNNSAVATTNPVSPTMNVTQTGQIVISVISPDVNCQSAANPFVFTLMTRGDATAYANNPSPGTYAASYSCAAGSFASTSAVFGSGTTSGLGVAITPTTASVVTNGTQNFSPTVTNDPAGAGVTIALSGAGCSGATCGAVTPAGFSDNFAAGSLSSIWTIDTGTAPGNITNVNSGTFSASNVSLVAGNLQLKVTQSGSTPVNSVGAEVRTVALYGYGLYTWSMRSASTATTIGGGGSATSGSISSGFTICNTAANPASCPTYTEIDSPEVEEQTPHNIEFTNWTSTSTNSTCSFNLVAGADQAVHNYSANWTPGQVIYSVDGTPVCTKTTNVPTAPAFILLQVWGTNSTGFGGLATVGTTRFVYFNNFAYVPFIPSGSTVTYKAPAAIPSPATVSLTAASVTSPGTTAAATITVASTATVNVTVAPANPSTTAGGATVALTATVTNDPANKGVTWAINPGCGAACGTISATSSASGVPITYTPPATLTSTQSVTVTATSVADNTKSATSTIIVSPAGGAFSCSGTNCPAFHGALGNAEGAGATSPGGSGRNGAGTPTIILVTNNTDSGAGSWRACLEATGPRFCVPRVSGSPTNVHRLAITHPNITILGQMAPGGPITFHSASQANCLDGSNPGCGTLWVETSNVVMRYVTYDGSANTPTGPDQGTVGFEIGNGPANAVILDHISARWWGNKVFVINSNDSGTTHDITVQNSLMYEPNVNHPVILELDTTCSAPTCSALNSVRQYYHHNIGINYARRWPLVNIHSLVWDNNISFNCCNNFSPGGSNPTSDFVHMAWGGLVGDYVGNKVVNGPSLATPVHPYLWQSNPCTNDSSDSCPSDNPGPPSIYMLNNFGPVCDAATRDSCSTTGTNITPTNVVNDTGEKNMTFQGWEGGEEGTSNHVIAPVPAAWFRSTPQPAVQFPITITPVTQLDSVLTPIAGNSQALNCDGTIRSNRDTQDARVINQYLTGANGSQFNGQFSSPPVAAGTPCAMTFAVGLYDAWILKWGLPTNDPNLAIKTDPNTGYLYIEDLANGLNP